MGRKLDVKGLKFGHLTAIERVGRHPTQRTAIWKWRCDCGNEREIEARRVVAGHTRTCGKCEWKHKINPHSGMSKRDLGKKVTREYQKYMRRAERRKLKFELSLNEFSALLREPCTLCGVHPAPSTFHEIEPASHRGNYTQGNVYIMCSKCSSCYSKIGISQVVERILACSNHLKNSY